jgi:starch synthase (maltosyl-transferring)
MMRTAPGSIDYRIYYMHPLLAGGVREWGKELDRCAAMGFDQVLVAPLLAPGRGGDLFLTSDPQRANPALGWSGDAVSALAHAASLCRERGLRLLVDLVVDRVAEDSPLCIAHPALFAAADARTALDPRGPRGAWGAVAARWDEPEAAAALWAGLVAEWAAAGVAGVRIASLGAVPPAGLRALIGRVRATAPDFRLLGWTPGLAAPAVQALRGAGLDGVFSSLPWWNFRDGWLWDEAAQLHGIAATIAAPEAPFGPRLAARWPDPATVRAAYLRALGAAASLEAGWLMPMGFEVAAMQPLPAAHARPGLLAAWRREAPFDLTAAVAAANAARAGLPGDGGGRLLSGSGADVIAVLRGAAADARRACVVLLNADLAAAREVAVSSLLPGAGIPLAGLREGKTVFDPAAMVRLAPAEARILEAVPAGPVRQPIGRGARVAAAAPRIGIESIAPAVGGGPFAARRLVGEVVTVEADLLCDGHDVLGAVVVWRAADEKDWHEAPLRPIGNDRWTGTFPLARLGRHQFAIEAWRDVFATFRDELAKKHAAGLSLTLELEEGRRLVQQAAERSGGDLAAVAARLEGGDATERREVLLAEATADLMRAADDRPFRVRSEPPLQVEAERTAAEFASWYELFPRSMSDDPARHGTFVDVIGHLPRIRAMGFDVLYLPPIHPIGQANRKGRNNTIPAGPDDPGSPYAIGAAAGGHDAVHPELGTIEDFRRLRDAAAALGMELALDFAIQCAPDHPWLRAHPDWFDWRPDGSLRYAENPPKKYEDIVNVDFYAPGAVPSLWAALRDVVLFWLNEGVRIFRVDNPHTKPLPFWQWLIGEVRARDPGVIFLAEAFTRPKMMYRLGKVGFSQSYSYFTWRNTKAELEAYFTELATTPPREFFRPHLFVNTPDINPFFLQTSGRAGFLIRAALAATLSGLWGVYCGFELCEAAALPGREEYHDSEKYQLRAWDWDRPGNIAAEIGRLNRIRRDNPALHSHLGVRFYNAGNDLVLYYGKANADRSNVVLVAVNLDPHAVQEADIEIPLWEFGLPDSGSLLAEDLQDGHSFRLQGKRQRVRLDPATRPFEIWRLSGERQA